MVVEPQGANQESERHEQYHRQTDVVGRKVARHEAGKNPQGCAALFRGSNDFFHVARFGGGEDLHQLRDDGARERATRDDGGQLPPLRSVAAKVRDDHRRDDVGKSNRNGRGDPHQRSERRFVIHMIGFAVLRAGNEAVNEVGGGAGDEHDDAHYENPNQ